MARRPADIKGDVMSRFKHGELRRPTGELVSDRQEALAIALRLAAPAAPPECDQLKLFDLGEPSQAHQLLYQGNLGAHATEAIYLCRLCRVTVAEVGRGRHKRRYWGESRSLTEPRCKVVT